MIGLSGQRGRQRGYMVGLRSHSSPRRDVGVEDKVAAGAEQGTSQLSCVRVLLSLPRPHSAWSHAFLPVSPHRPLPVRPQLPPGCVGSPACSALAPERQGCEAEVEAPKSEDWAGVQAVQGGRGQVASLSLGSLSEPWQQGPPSALFSNNRLKLSSRGLTHGRPRAPPSCSSCSPCPAFSQPVVNYSGIFQLSEQHCSHGRNEKMGAQRGCMTCSRSPNR